MTAIRRKGALHRLRIAAPYRLGLRTCTHPVYEVTASRRHRHPDGRPQSYHRCPLCLRTLWRPWENRRRS
jgi:hypothetical protein